MVFSFKTHCPVSHKNHTMQAWKENEIYELKNAFLVKCYDQDHRDFKRSTNFVEVAIILLASLRVQNLMVKIHNP